MFAKPRLQRWLSYALITILAGWAGLSAAQEDSPEPKKPKDIVAIAKDTKDVTTFCKLLESAELVETLKGKGPYTVFIPTDDAFKKLGKQLEELQKPENRVKLQRVLKNHILEGQKAEAEIKAMKSAKTLAGETLKITIKDDVLTVDKAKLTKADVKADNGLIHVVDTVLMPAEPSEEKD